MKAKPIGKKVLVAIPKTSEKRVGNIVLPGQNNEFQLHEVLAVGDEVTKVKVSEKVYLPPYGGFNFMDGYKIVEESDIIAVDV